MNSLSKLRTDASHDNLVSLLNVTRIAEELEVVQFISRTPTRDGNLVIYGGSAVIESRVAEAAMVSISEKEAVPQTGSSLVPVITVFGSILALFKLIASLGTFQFRSEKILVDEGPHPQVFAYPSESEKESPCGG